MRCKMVGLQRFIMLSGDLPQICLKNREAWKLSPRGPSGLLCIRSTSLLHATDGNFGPQDIITQTKVEFLPYLLSLGVRMVWLDADIYLLKDPSIYFAEQ